MSEDWKQRRDRLRESARRRTQEKVSGTVHTFDTMKGSAEAQREPLAGVFASVAKLEEERTAQMADQQNPPNTVAPTGAKLPETVPDVLNTAKPIVPIVPDAAPKGVPIAPGSGGALPAATPDGVPMEILAAQNAAAAAAAQKPQVAPVVMPAAAVRSAGETVTMVFPHRVLLTIDHATQVEFQAGVQEVPEHLAEHPYLKSNRVVRYSPTVAEAAGFAPTVVLKESPFCPNCGKATSLHTGPLKACPA